MALRKMPVSEFRKLNKKELQQVAPVILTFDGEVIGHFCEVDEVVVIGDMHPRVQRQFKAREQLVRRGMPTDIRKRLR